MNDFLSIYSMSIFIIVCGNDGVLNKFRILIFDDNHERIG
jgi:hypothetical protein